MTSLPLLGSCPEEDILLPIEEGGGYYTPKVDDTLKDGRYKICRKLGFGRNSSVWLVFDTRHDELSAQSLSLSLSQFPMSIVLTGIAILQRTSLEIAVLGRQSPHRSRHPAPSPRPNPRAADLAAHQRQVANAVVFSVVRSLHAPRPGWPPSLLDHADGLDQYFAVSEDGGG